MMHVIRMHRWGFDAGGADYYGYALWVHIGPWAVLVWPTVSAKDFPDAQQKDTPNE